MIGVLEPKGTSGFGQDQDNVVMMPLIAFQRRIAGDRDVDSIYVAADDGVPTSTVQAEHRDDPARAPAHRAAAPTTISTYAT